ncbi:hypothetical protein Sste5346_006941 [Sporothrix stenoceras]|uniref:Beta-fructofuranosidase n=1 Tax=Sporothrix stenoceras TaxID=5173 RepID=A0ABR3YX53_9PEZI
MAAVVDQCALPPSSEPQRSKTSTVVAVTAVPEVSPPATPPAVPSSWYTRPRFHLKAPRGWLNDPCAPGYDPATGTYHLFYQWNPNRCDWGDIAWGHCTSRDGLRWTHRHASEPTLRPDQVYDDHGVFTGCFWPTGPHDEAGKTTVVYSSVRDLPIHWTRPYTRDCAGLALATSTDGGNTWQKNTSNPVLTGEPDDIVVTGFRDPYLAPWAAMDDVRGVPTDAEPQTLYGIVSGGVIGKGPTVFVYTVPANNLTSWTYLGPLVDILVDQHPASHWSGDFGVNWECANFMTLECESRQQDFLVFSTEGGLPRSTNNTARTAAHNDGDVRSGTYTLWMAGKLQSAPQTAQTKTKAPPWQPQYSGFLDCGSFYAPNTYQHPVSGTRVCWGWIREDSQLDLARREDRGWAGYLSLPRELFLLCLTGVTSASKTPLADIPSIEAVPKKDGVSTVYTLGIRPLPSLVDLRKAPPRVWSSLRQSGPLATARSAHWEMQATIQVSTATQGVGFHLRHRPDGSRGVSVYWVPDEEKLVVDTRRSTEEADLIPKEALSGPLTLFTFADGTTESLRLHIFCDGDVLEVFANDRFALSTTVYGGTETCRGISCLVEGAEVAFVFESIQLWEDLDSVDTSVE